MAMIQRFSKKIPFFPKSPPPIKVSIYNGSCFLKEKIFNEICLGNCVFLLDKDREFADFCEHLGGQESQDPTEKIASRAQIKEILISASLTKLEVGKEPLLEKTFKRVWNSQNSGEPSDTFSPSLFVEISKQINKTVDCFSIAGIYENISSEEGSSNETLLRFSQVEARI